MAGFKFANVVMAVKDLIFVLRRNISKEVKEGKKNPNSPNPGLQSKLRQALNIYVDFFSSFLPDLSLLSQFLPRQQS